MRLKNFLTWLSLTIGLYFVASIANAYLTPLYTTISGQGQFSDGTVSAPSISFTNQTDAGEYRIGSNSIGMAVAGILGQEWKKSTGAFVNVGIGGAASTSDTSPFYINRSLSTAWDLLSENSNTGAGSGVKFKLKSDSGNQTFEMGLFAAATVAPYAYRGGRGTQRCTDGCPGISAISDGAATGNMEFYMGGNAVGNLMFIMDQYGLTLTANAAARPTCDSTKRGMLYNKIGGAAVADELDMCMKGSADTYSWVTVIAAP